MPNLKNLWVNWGGYCIKQTAKTLENSGFPFLSLYELQFRENKNKPKQPARNAKKKNVSFLFTIKYISIGFANRIVHYHGPHLPSPLFPLLCGSRQKVWYPSLLSNRLCFLLPQPQVIINYMNPPPATHTACVLCHWLVLMTYIHLIARLHLAK